MRVKANPRAPRFLFHSFSLSFSGLPQIQTLWCGDTFAHCLPELLSQRTRNLASGRKEQSHDSGKWQLDSVMRGFSERWRERHLLCPCSRKGLLPAKFVCKLCVQAALPSLCDAGVQTRTSRENMFSTILPNPGLALLMSF